MRIWTLNGIRIAFPYPDGRISPQYIGDDAIYGFDISTRAIYPWWSGDLMTYCDYQWLSDFTYEALMTTFQNTPVVAAAAQQTSRADRLIIVGTIDPASGATKLETPFVIPQALDVEPPTSGDYTILLRDADGAALSRYPFTPDEMYDRPAGSGERDVELLAISEFVPAVAGAVELEITGPTGSLVTVRAGPNPPTVTVLTPNSGGTFAGDLEVAWSAGDPDGDPLTFSVQYSPDDGATWETLAQNVTGTTTTLPGANLVAGDRGQVRVWVSDGLHTAADQSDVAFSVPNHPPAVRIVQPEQDMTIFIEQSLGLVAEANDPDTGSMDESLVQWSSSLDGALGDGAQLTLASLRPGVHVVTVSANDRHGGVTTDAVTVTVRSDLFEPAIPAAYLPLVTQ